jgi:hypothetical protein
MNDSVKEKKAKEKAIFDKIVNYPSKNERIAWNRKHKKMKAMIDENISPIEMKILELTMDKMKHMDDAMAIREILSTECVHPREFLILRDKHVFCKFCDAKLKVNV